MLYTILAIVGALLCLRINPILGVIVTLLILAYGIFYNLPSFYTMRANAKFNNGDLGTALKLYKKAYKTGRAKPNLVASYTTLLMRSGEFEEALKVINLLLMRKLKPQEKSLAKQTRCMVHYKMGNMEDAIEEANELFYEDGYKSAHMYSMIGLFKIINHDPPQEVLDFCLEAYDYDEENRDILDNLCVAYYQMKDYEKAEEISEQLMEMAPKFVEAYYHGAQVQLALGHKEKAAEYLEKIKDCRRSAMTTIPEEAIEALCAQTK